MHFGQWRIGVGPGYQPANWRHDYAIAALAIVASVVIAFGAFSLLHTSVSFFPFQLAIAVAAIVGGVGPGVAATFAATFLAIIFREPFGLPGVGTQEAQASIALFFVEGVAIAGLGQLVRSGRAAVEASAREHADLLYAERSARGAAEHAISRAEGLAATAAALGRALRTEEVTDIAVREGLARLGAGRGAVGLLEPDGRTVRTVAALGFAHDIKQEWPTFDIDDNVPLSEAMRIREPLILRTAEEIRDRYPSLAATTLDGGPAVVVPLMFEDRAIGGMYFRYSSSSSVAEDDRSYLSALGRQIASAVERARLFEAKTRAAAEAERVSERIAFLAQVSDTLVEVPSIDAALANITRLAVPSIADWSAVFLLGSNGEIRPVALHHRDPTRLSGIAAYLERRPPQITDRAGAGATIASGHVELVTDYPARLDELGVGEEERQLLADSRIRSVMHCPLLAERRVFGTLTLATTGERSFEQADIAFGEDVGRRLGTALERVGLSERLADRLHGQEAVARLGQLALLHSELEPLLAAAAKELADVLDADITAIMEHVPNRHSLKIVAGTGWRDGVVGQTLISDSGRSQAGFALISDGPIVSLDYKTEERFRPSPALQEHGARSGATTPIPGPNGPWGVIGVHSRQPGHFAPDQIALLDTFANVLGSAVSRHTAEVALHDRDQRLELALAASRTGFWEWNVRTGHMLLSNEICRVLGLPAGTELESLDAYLALVHEQDRDWVRERFEGASSSGAFDARFRIVLPNGKVRWTHSTAKVFLNPEHKLARMIGVGRDVTDEVELEAERTRMAEAERRAGELGQVFIGIVSHELRTPITAIFGGSKLLRRMGDSRPEARAELTADIEAESERLYRLTEDLLVLTRVERGGLEIGLEPVALPRVLERVIGSEQERWPLTTIELVVQPAIPIAHGDNTYIEQLIRNLVGNAAKYAPQGGTVQVIATATQPSGGAESQLEVRVLDRGPGLAEADLDHLFELFYRSPLTARKAPGAGIGLFVCDQLARAMGGRLWASNREGGGSEFGFSLRTYQAEQEASRPLVASSRSRPRAAVPIAIVDEAPREARTVLA